VRQSEALLQTQRALRQATLAAEVAPFRPVETPVREAGERADAPARDAEGR
jgi:hypothetical protein